MVFISNSPKDGFREGDGDLMDKLTTQLNKVSPKIAAIRIVGEAPPAEIQRPADQLIAIDDLPEPIDDTLNHLHPLHQKLIQYIISHPAKNKIFYIGSRIDNFRKQENKDFCISVGSGALLTEEVILILKMHQVKIVICCLEIAFHTRSLHTSFRLYEMLRHHLQHADAIHYLTARDQDFVQKDLIEQLTSGVRLSHPEYPAQKVEDYLFKVKRHTPKNLAPLVDDLRQFFVTYFESDMEKYRNYFSYFNQASFIEKIRSIPGVYAPGICTINGLSLEEASTEHLMKRDPNVLVFGLIRSHKGIEEGLALGKLFKDRGSRSTVYIVGKILGLSSIFKRLFTEIFDVTSIKEKGISLAKRLSECHHSENYNVSFQQLYNDLVSAGVTKKAQVELVLDVSEDDLVKYSQRCRYALKLDVKGFAENASSMISTMIGLCLPVIAQPGLVTPDFAKSYAPALHLLDTQLSLRGTEVVPPKTDPASLLPIIEESDEQYLQRIRAIQALRSKKQFDIETTTNILLDKLFIPFFRSTRSTNRYIGVLERGLYSFFAMAEESAALLSDPMIDVSQVKIKESVASFRIFC